MVHYEFRLPNLVELLLFVAVVFIIGFGFWLLIKAFGMPFEAIQTTTNALTAVFSWLSLILLGIIAIILESIREHLKNIEKKLK